MHPAPDQSRRDHTQSWTVARIRVSASPRRGGAVATRRIALHRAGLPWVKRTRRKVQWTFLPPSGSGQGWRTLGLQAKRRKASPGVLGETGRSSIELNLDNVALWRWSRKG